jgi:hypothetical protein
MMPPDIGVSKNFIPTFLASSANPFDAIGEIVEVSTMQVPLAAF